MVDFIFTVVLLQIMVKKIIDNFCMGTEKKCKLKVTLVKCI